ncbi:hypothetical protein C2861_26500 (plasmid) [Klebsiella pneumoniae]|uniref:hypothetical protein n=1 Tax=Klebsiella pneumoniae TaxID=573 RepID=UPI000D52E61A|nr:hypothetical protein [Klebsiella pneumoniae]AWG15296.1 hypothetical protein C2861_26500 [Klebsiella pneumoniae]
MDINYYDEHQEEFEAVKLALKGEMERIWGSMLKESGDSLDDEATYLNRHCCKVSDEAAFCLIQRPYISKTLLTRRISPRGSP